MVALEVQKTPAVRAFERRSLGDRFSELKRAVREPISDRIDKLYRDTLTTRLISEMESRGFVLLNKKGSAHCEKYKKELSYLLEKDDTGDWREFLFKRKEGSNFFVFARKEKGGIKIHYTDPDTSERAWKLKRREIVITEVLLSDDDNPAGSVSKAIDRIVAVSKNKDANTHFVDTHSHMGSVPVGPDYQGNEKDVGDDGTSSLRDYARNFILGHGGIKASGPHNKPFKREEFETVSRIFEAVGIASIASLEITLPVKGAPQPFGDITNGPHVMLYFSNYDAAEKFRNAHLSEPSEFPGAAAKNVEFRDMLGKMKELVDKGLLALIDVHPAGSLTNLIKEGVGCGILNALSDGFLGFTDVDRLFKELKAGIAKLNLTVLKNYEMKPKLNAVADAFSTWIKKLLGAPARFTEPLMNLAFAEEIHNKYGAFVVVETDKHYFHPMKYKSGVGSFSRAITMLKTNTPIHASEMTGEWFVEGLLKKDGFTLEGVAFCKLIREGDEVRAKIIPERDNTFWEKIDDFFASVKEGAKGAFFFAKVLIWNKIFKKEKKEPVIPVTN